MIHYGKESKFLLGLERSGDMYLTVCDTIDSSICFIKDTVSYQRFL